MKRVLNITLTVLVTIILTACAEKEVKQAPLPQYSVEKPELRDIVYHLDYPGFLQSELVVDIISRTEGYLEKMNVKPGQTVKAGDVLFVIEPKNYEDKLTEAIANLETAKANLVLAETTLERMKEASKSNAVSELDVVQAQTQVDLCKAAVKKAESGKSLAQTNLDYCYIKAPSNGRVSLNKIDVGNYVTPKTLLATLYKDDNLYVNFSIEASKLIWAQAQAKNSNIKLGKGDAFETINVYLTDTKGNVYSYSAKLDYLSPSADISTGTVDMRAVVNNKHKELNNGVLVNVSLPFKNVEKAVLIPESSIGTDQSGRYIYVVENDTVRYRSVQVGQLESDNKREILSGLSSDEWYVTKALTKVRNGQVINPIEKETSK
ncbi:MAG: efflux RND transporter periplasmic adaptor subunit [Paludibacteraceae bacterium]|nr:efflux RND transporter periplasmic adaptor subunit [Paludibacteraceae bacterium]